MKDGQFCYKKHSNGRCWSDELIYSKNWINFWKQPKEVKSSRLHPNLISKYKLESNILPAIFHVHEFSFPVFLLQVLSEAQRKKQWKPVNTTARSCAFPASWWNLSKNLSRMVPRKPFANVTQLQACWGRLEEFSKCHSSLGGTKLPGCGHPPQPCSGLIKSFQAR